MFIAAVGIVVPSRFENSSVLLYSPKVQPVSAAVIMMIFLSSAKVIVAIYTKCVTIIMIAW